MTTEKDRTPLSTEVNGAEGEVGQRRLDGIDRRSTQCQSREERFPQLGSVRGCSILLAEPNHSQPVQQRGRGKDQKKRSRDVTVNTAAAACVDWSRHPLWAAAQLRGLHRRTRYRSVGTKDAAMTGLGLEWDAASGARVKVNARVGWHLLLRGVSASGAGVRTEIVIMGFSAPGPAESRLAAVASLAGHGLSPQKPCCPGGGTRNCRVGRRAAA